MPATTQSILDTRRHQMFPILEPAEIERVRRFGKVRAYRTGEALATVGEVGLGLTVILAGKVDITQRHESDRSTPIVTHEAGAFMGELAQLAGRPALVDAHAQGAVEALESEVKNVFVTDGACMTSSACQNPSLTYMALTARATAFAVEELKRGSL